MNSKLPQILFGAVALALATAFSWHLVWAADWQCQRWQESCDRRNQLRAMLAFSFRPGDVPIIVFDTPTKRYQFQAPAILTHYQNRGWQKEDVIWRIVSSFAAGIGLAVGLYFFLRSRFFDRSQRASVDVDEDVKRFKRLAKPYDPEHYINLKKGIFFGLDERRRPVYLPGEVVDKNHMDVLGESGVGKSSLVGLLMSQLLLRGETCIVFDPKSDAYLPGVLARMAARGKRRVMLIDLRMSAPPQLNPLAGCRPDQVEELLQVALKLGETGDPGVDFHRGEDRAKTEIVAEAYAAGATCLPSLLTHGLRNEEIQKAQNFAREFRQLCRLPAFQTEDSVDLPAFIHAGGLIYVIGSTTDLKVHAAQRLLLQRFMQILEERSDRRRPVALFMDELKYLLSPAALRAAGTIRDRNCHLIFAHQSLGDLHDCPGLEPRAVEGAVWGNSGIRVAYRVAEGRTTKELELLSGQVRAYGETISKDRSLEREGGGWREGNRDRMPAHVFSHLPKPVGNEASVGILFGVGPAFALSTRWLPAGPAPEVKAASLYCSPDGQPSSTRAADLI